MNFRHLLGCDTIEFVLMFSVGDGDDESDIEELIPMKISKILCQYPCSIWKYFHVLELYVSQLLKNLLILGNCVFDYHR